MADLTRIRISDIIDQINSDVAYLEMKSRPPNGLDNPRFLLYFQANPVRDVTGKVFNWYYMNVWFLEPGREGYLRDSTCPYKLIKDVPFSELTACLNEYYVMAKIKGDDIATEGFANLFCVAGIGNLILNLKYDARYPENGYTEIHRISDQNYLKDIH